MTAFLHTARPTAPAFVDGDKVLDELNEFLAESLAASAQWSDVLQSPADIWEIGRNAGILDVIRKANLSEADALIAMISVERTDENPYAEAGDRIMLIEELDALLDDCDQVADTPENPNLVKVWAVRKVIERYGGKPHRWEVE